jgi:hypothetical protein
MPVSSAFEQFEQSIVRFFKPNGQEEAPNGQEEAGVGFWIDGHYVVTCAHVVNAALGLPEKSPDRPTKSIALEFVKAGESRSARVVGWHRVLETHEISDRTLEDLAILQLSEPPPNSAMAAGSLLAADYQVGNPFTALGFADEGGRWAYGQLRDRWPTTGWIQLEANRTEGKRVEGGFSGTPVWDAEQNRVVGLVVAADRAVGDRVAMAIPVAKVRSALRQLDVECLLAIVPPVAQASARWTQLYDHVKPPGYTVSCPIAPHDLLKALQDMPEQPNAPGDPLLLFVAGLAWDLDLPKAVRDRLEQWLAVRSPNPNALESYLRQLDPATHPSGIPRTPSQPCLLIVLEPSDQYPDRYRVRAWAMNDRRRPHHEPLHGDEQPIAWDALPQWFATLKAKIAHYAWPDRTIEIFLPLALLNEAIDQIAPEDDDFDALFAVPLGGEYRVVVRSSERLRATYKYRGEWQQKWRQLQEHRQDCAIQHLRSGNCASEDELKTLVLDLMCPEVIGIRRSQPPEPDLRRSILAASLRTGLPVAVWMRSEATDLNPQTWEETFNSLIAGPLENLPDRVLEARRAKTVNSPIAGPLENLPDRVLEARRAKTVLGQHLSLLWDDPTCLPPGYLDGELSMPT